MDTLKARVVQGRLVLDEPCDLPEGTVLELVAADAGDDLDDDERKELHAALDRAWQGVKSGEPGISADDLISRLRKRG